MKIEAIEKLIQETRSKMKLNNEDKRSFKVKIVFEGGSIQEGIIYATDVNDAIIKNYMNLKNQGVIEIVEDIECFN